MAWWWSWLLPGLGLAGTWLAGNHNAHGWRFGIAQQVPWITYAIATHQWGFFVSAMAYGFINGRNLIKWNRESAQNSNSPQPSAESICEIRSMVTKWESLDEWSQTTLAEVYMRHISDALSSGSVTTPSPTGDGADSGYSAPDA